MKKSLNIFLSHSSKDFPMVRKIRNLLENMGHKPLMFHLKCLEQSSDDELFQLIKREIDCREWFILCKSKKAEESKWVMREMQYVEENPNKLPEIINLDKDMGNLNEKINNILHNLLEKSSVFIYYPQKYAFFVKKLYTYLTDQEYNVWCDFEETGIEDSVEEHIQNVLYNITNPKGVIVLILENNDFVKWKEEEEEEEEKKGKEIASINKHITFIIHDEALNDRDFMSELKSENFIFNLKKSGEKKWLKIIETAIRIYNISIEIRKKENDYMLYHQRGELYENIGLLINAVNDYHKADNLLEANPPLNKMVYKNLKSHYFNHWDDVHHELAELSHKYNK